MLEVDKEADWLEGDSESRRAEQRAKAIEFAENYLVFEKNAQARAVLEQMETAVEARDLPPDSSHAEYAYYEGQRALVRGIRRQIALANTKQN